MRHCGVRGLSEINEISGGIGFSGEGGISGTIDLNGLRV